MLQPNMTQSGALPVLPPAENRAHSLVTWPKAAKYGAGRCWWKQLLIDSSSGHLEAIFILEFLPMLLKHPLSHLKCLVLISSISDKVPFGGSESDGHNTGT